MVYKVLVTDDDEGCRISLHDMLDRRGYDAYLASDGLEALKVYRSVNIDVAILDFHLPGMTGLEFWERILEEHKRRLPCVFITGDIQEARLLRERPDLGYPVVTKPLSMERIMKALEAMILKHVTGRAR